MEELKRRLDFRSPAVKAKAIRRGMTQVLRRKEKDIITDKSAKIAELEFLWEKCGDSDVTVCHAACQSLLQLVTHYRAADYHFLLNRLLSYAPSAQSLCGIVRTVTDLLVFELLVTVEQKQSFINPYSIRVRPHPLITLLTNRADCWPLILTQVCRVLTWQNASVRENAIKLLGPFLKFVLLEPNQSIQFTAVRMSLPASCLQMAAQDASLHGHMVTWLLELIPSLQMKTVGNVGEATHFLQTLSQHIMTHHGTLGYHHLATLSRRAFDLACICVKDGHDGSALIELSLAICRHHPQSVRDPVILSQCATLLYYSPSHDYSSLLQLLTTHLKQNQTDTHERSSSECANVVLLGSCVLPLLTVSMATDDMEEDGDIVSKQASLALQLVQSQIDDAKTMTSSNDAKVIPTNQKEDTSQTSYEGQFLVTLCRKLSADRSYCITWLDGVTKLLHKKSPHPSCELICVACSVLIVGADEDVTRRALKVLCELAKLDQAQSLLLLPVLLYKMSSCHQPEIKLHILNTVPKLATTKASVNLILRTLQHIGGSPSLKALSLRLITSLWKQQDRCFPYLQQFIMEKDFSGVSEETGVNEVLLAKAASIRDVCKIRPYDHGKDMVTPISNLLNECTAEQDAPSVSLALEGLYYLCEAEEIDVKTAWSVLAAKLSQDKRPLAVKGVCQLLSLVPSLAEQHQAYEKFTTDVVDMMWAHANDWSADPLIATSAFQALSKFEPRLFQLKHLPKQVTGELLADALAAAEDMDPDDVVIPPVTGKCYTDLLRILPQPVHAGFEEFLEALICHEVTNMPRGMQHASSRRQHTSSGHGKALTAIPHFLSTQYEKNRQPGVRPALSVGLLFSYEPQLEVGRDGKPRRNHIAQLGRRYHRMLYTLMNEVPIQPSDWYRCVYTPGAWTSFMERCYHAYVQSRVAELQLKLHSGEETMSPEENKLMQDTAWLWARDKLMDLIKSSSKGSPSVQGNATCALAGLAVASCKHAAGLDDAMMALTEQVPEHLSQGHWLSLTCNTLMAVVDHTYKPQGRIFAMCGLRSDSERTPAALLARSSAAIALSQLIRPLISLNADLVYKILALLSVHLPGHELKCSADEGEEAPSEEPGVVQFHYGLGMGWVIWSLFEEKFLDATGSQGMIATWKAIGDLETSAFSQSDNRTGSLLGLAVALSAMCKDGKPDSKVHVCGLHEKLTAMLHAVPPTDTANDAVCLCLASIAASGYAANVLPQASVDQTVAAIYQAHMQNPQKHGACAALGSACYGLMVSQHPSVKDLAQKLFSTWLSQLRDPNVAVQEKITIILGIFNIAGGCNSIFQMENGQEMGKHINQSDLISCAKELLQGNDVALTSVVPWLLGQLYFSSFDVTDAKSSVPSSYNYLEDTSMLKASIQLLIEAGKTGPETLSPALVSIVLRALVQGTSQALPPLNWASIMSPLMRMSYGAEIQGLCLQMAVKQSQGSPSAAMFVTSWLLSPLYDSLSLESQLQVFESLPILIRSVPHTKLESYLTNQLLALFTSPDAVNHVMCERALWGLLGALKVNDPPQNITLLLYRTLETLYVSPAVVNNVDFTTIVCECMREIPDAMIDKITGDDFRSHDRMEHAVFVRCYLVGCGNQPLAWLNSAIEASLLCEERVQSKVLQLVYRCLLAVRSCKGDNASASHQSVWLLELMGHTRNLASGVLQQGQGLNPLQLQQLTRFMIGVFGSAVIAFNQSDHHIFIGTSAIASPALAQVQKRSGNEQFQNNEDSAFMNTLFSTLPGGLCSLVQVEPWKQMITKFVDWLLTLLGAPCLQDSFALNDILKGCLRSMRHSKEFMKIATWSRAFTA